MSRQYYIMLVYVRTRNLIVLALDVSGSGAEHEGLRFRVNIVSLS